MELRGIPAAVVCTEPFENMGRSTARIRGIPDYPFKIIPHPFGRIDDATLDQRVDETIDAVESLLLNGTLGE